MSSSRVDATPINLKERIAALQQLSNTSNPPPSPSLSSNNDVSSAVQPSTANANIKLREKIARFEKKGGVPVPRGSFGLGAPPLQDGHTKRQGELYGNRIPQTVRVASGPQAAPSPSGLSHPPSATMRPKGNNRRSFSLSTVNTLMASEFAGGVDTPLTSSSAGEPVYQVSGLSAGSSARLKSEQDQSPVVSPLPAIVISQGEGDSVTEPTGLPLKEEAQVAAGVDAEVPSTVENVSTASAYSSDIDLKPPFPSPSDISDSPSFSSSPPSALSSSPHLDAASAGSPTLSPAPSTDKTLLRAAGLGTPLASSVPQQRTANSKADLVSSDDESSISNSPVMSIALGSPQSVSESSTSSAHSAKKIYQKENVGDVDGEKADTRGEKAPPPALDLDSDIAQPRNPSKETAISTQKDKRSAAAVESDIPSSPTTPHATPSPLPEASRSTSIKSSTSLEMCSHLGASIRPASMIEPIPIHVQPAQREAESERGSVAILDQHLDSSSHQNLSSHRAVVHNKKRDDPSNSRSLAPQIPQVRRASSTPLGPPSANALDTTTTTIPSLPVITTSSGLGDLSDLLQSTVLLEQTLESGVMSTVPGIPAIVSDDGDVSREIVTTRPDGVEVRRLSKGEAEENKRTLAKLQAKREEQAKSKLRSSFRNTLTRAVGGGNGGSTSGAGVTASFDTTGESVTVTSQQEQQPQYYSKRFKSPSVPQLLDSTPDNGSTRSKTPENQIGRANKPESLTSSKSAKSRFPNFRRLTSSSKSSDGHGGRLTRSSFSTSSEISSEDSSPAAVTPPDVATEFGEAVKGRKGTRDSEMSWQISPQKKGKDSMSRAATFAGKIWSRARTRSGASTLSTQSSLGRTSSEAPPSLPPLPDLILPEESEDLSALVRPPARSTSLSPRSPKYHVQLPSQSPDLSLSASFDTEGTRSSTPVQSFKHPSSLSPEFPFNAYTSQSRRRSEMPPTSPSSPPSIRPLSWMSESSSGSHLNTSLAMLDSDFFDAFPSVPENQPLVLQPPNPSSSHSRTQQQAVPMMSKTTQPSFSSSTMSFLPSPDRDAGSG